MADLAARQNSDGILDLLRAIAVAHKRSQRVYATALLVSIAVAALGVLAKVVPSTASAVSLTGAVWTAVYAVVLSRLAARHQRTGAALQDIMDSTLFDLKPNPVLVGASVPEDQISDLKSRYRGKEKRLRDYYLIARIPEPYATLFCFEQNFAWGSTVRQRYAQLLAWLATVWVLTGLAIGFATGMRVPALFGGWIVPSLGLVLLCLDTYRVQMSSNRERARVRDIVVGLSDEPTTPPPALGPEWDALARRLQDVLFIVRRQQPRTPDWFFRRYHERDKRNFEYRKKKLEDRFNPPTQP